MSTFHADLQKYYSEHPVYNTMSEVIKSVIGLGFLFVGIALALTLTRILKNALGIRVSREEWLTMQETMRRTNLLSIWAFTLIYCGMTYCWISFPYLRSSLFNGGILGSVIMLIWGISIILIRGRAWLRYRSFEKADEIERIERIKEKSN